MKVNVIFSLLALTMVWVGCKKEQFDLERPIALVVNGASHNVSIIDFNTQEVVEEMTLPEGSRYPHHIYLNADGDMGAISITDTDLSGSHSHGVSATGNYMVLVFEPLTGKTIKVIELDAMAHNAVFSPDGEELWLGQAGDPESQVVVYDTKRFKEQKRITVGSGLSEVTFSQDGTRAYAVNTGGNSVSIIDPTTKTVLKTLTVDAGPVGAWPAANGRMYLDAEDAQTVLEISVAGDTIMTVTSLGFKPGYVAYHSSRDQIWVSDATNGAVVVFENTTGVWHQIGLIPTGADAHAIGFSHDGSQAFVTNQGAGIVSVIDVQGFLKLKDITVGSKPNGLAILQ